MNDNNNDLLDYNFAYSNVRCSHLNSEEKSKLINLCSKYRDIFYNPNDEMTFIADVKHEIKWTNETPVHIKSSRLPHAQKLEVNRQIQERLDKNIIRHSNSPWSAPVFIVSKRADASGIKKFRLVTDYRKLNENTVYDSYPIPNIHDILDKLGKCQYFTTFTSFAS